MIYYAAGDAIVSGEELLEPATVARFAELSTFSRSTSKAPTPETLALSTGTVTPQNALTGYDPGTGIVPFKEIGPGKPLTIMIRHVYTGRFPKAGFLGASGKDLLITSAVKSITTFEAKPRAINFLKPKQGPKSHIERPSAGQQGTPVVFYSPALLEKALTLDLTLVFDTFPKEVFEKVGSAFQSAASIPIFLSYSVYLLAAGALAKIVGAAGEAIFDGRPAFDTSSALDIYFPGQRPLPPGFALISDDNIDVQDKDFRTNYHVSDTGQVVDKAGQPYTGEVPYVVVSYDGSEEKELEAFAPTAATAAILSRFFGIKDNQALPLDLLLDAVKLYNDFKHRQEADRLDDQIKGLKKDDPRRKPLEEKREALIGNILADLLKPPAAAGGAS